MRHVKSGHELLQTAVYVAPSAYCALMTCICGCGSLSLAFQEKENPGSRHNENLDHCESSPGVI